jgi:predicted ATPase
MRRSRDRNGGEGLAFFVKISRPVGLSQSGFASARLISSISSAHLRFLYVWNSWGMDDCWTSARRQQAKSLELRAAASLARLWGEQGRGGEARDLLAQVYG